MPYMEQDSVEAGFARAMAELVVDSDSWGTSELLSRLDALEARFGSASPDLERLEFKRRVAEQKLILCGERLEIGLDEIERLRSVIEDLGYSNLERRALIEIIFARHCLARRAKRRAKETLSMFLEYLNGEFRDQDGVFFGETRKQVADLIQQAE
jgi:hypothetical protein